MSCYRGVGMSEITREKLHAYLDDALSDIEAAHVEQALRESERCAAHCARPCRNATGASIPLAPSGDANA